MAKAMDEKRYLELARDAALQQLAEDAQRVSPSVMRILDLVRAHLFEPDFGEAHLLSELGPEADSIAHDFLLTLGESPAQYLQTIRVLGSIQLIGKTSLSFDRIAELLGWPSLSSLSKSCRWHYGSSPSELRDQARRDHSDLCLEPPPPSELLSDEEREQFARRLAQRLGEWLTPDKAELLATGELQVDPLVFELMKTESN